MAGIITIGAASSTEELLGEDRENLLQKVPGDEPGDSEIPIFQC